MGTRNVTFDATIYLGDKPAGRKAGCALSPLGWLSVVSGVIGVLSFVFAFWVWMRSDVRVRELTGTLQSIYDISGNILWETINLSAEDTETQLRQAERAVGLASSIYTLSSNYVSATPEYRATEIGALIKRGIILTRAMIWNIETSSAVKEVWLVTPDLKPDVSEKAVGDVVGTNLRKGKRYVYFVPANLDNLPDLALRLEANLGISSLKSRQRKLLVLVRLEVADFQISAGTGNVIFFFKTDSKSSRGDAFREIVLTKVSELGVFWQECTDAEAESMYQLLRKRLEEQNA
jgi:hypothetical protein